MAVPLRRHLLVVCGGGHDRLTRRGGATGNVRRVFLERSKFAPPLWIHAVPWPIFVLGGAVAMLRPSKATLIALQSRHLDL
ncbi:MAG: DUF983 domain-containing protein [Alphaproteobacteria bacterium]|nr:DUF983 domain-containing protein [Alphaproteobacteria bacterium]MBM3628057.1 DUF983 domain-containing protein [Alphaproteobacteria bacterium]